jgi:adenylate kinase
MRVVLFGAPGAGKGTQAERLVNEFGLLHLSTGEVLRKAIRDGTELGSKAQAFMDRGDLVPDEVVIGIVKEAVLGFSPNQGFILDGFPRTMHQAEELESFLKKECLELTCVVSLEVSEEELVSRIMGRRTKSVETRSDDSEEAIRLRFKAFSELTLPLKKFYGDRHLLREIDGAQSVDRVYESVRAAVLGV